MNLVDIDYDEILDIISEQMEAVANRHPSVYANYSIIVTKEQDFINSNKMTPGHIYVVVKMLPASLTYGQSVLPVSMVVMSEQNKSDAAQDLLIEYASTYNLTRVENDTIQQIYEAPTVVTNFATVAYGYRSILRVSGTFVIAKNANIIALDFINIENVVISNAAQTLPVGSPELIYNNGEWVNSKYTITESTLKAKINEVIDDSQTTAIHNLESIKDGDVVKIEYFNVTTFNIYLSRNNGTTFILISSVLITYLDDYGIEKTTLAAVSDVIMLDMNYEVEEVPMINFAFGTQNSLDTQPFFSNNNFTKSDAMFRTFNFNYSTFLLSNSVSSNKILDVALGIISNNYPFRFKIKFKNGRILEKQFKLTSINGNQNIGEIPLISVVMTN